MPVGLSELRQGQRVRALWMNGAAFSDMLVVRVTPTEVELARPYAVVEEHQFRPLLGFEPIPFNLSDTRPFWFEVL
jgi:hypothetical protein